MTWTLPGIFCRKISRLKSGVFGVTSSFVLIYKKHLRQMLLSFSLLQDVFNLLIMLIAILRFLL